jgi:hypothetical protein
VIRRVEQRCATPIKLAASVLQSNINIQEQRKYNSMKEASFGEHQAEKDAVNNFN